METCGTCASGHIAPSIRSGQRRIMSRQSAYRWMADYFGLRVQDAHIGMFNEYRCQKLIEKSREVLEQCGKAAS